MGKIGQILVNRETKTVDEGTMGFHDYVTHKEDLSTFMDRVSSIANKLNNKHVISINYLSEDKAIIVYVDINKIKQKGDNNDKSTRNSTNS